MKLRLLLFCIGLNLSLSIVVNSQTELLVVYRKSDEAQNIFSSETFPTDEIKEICAENQQFIDEVSYDGVEWFVVTSSLDYTGQTYILSKDIPTDWIKSNWNKGYYIKQVKKMPN